MTLVLVQRVTLIPILLFNFLSVIVGPALISLILWWMITSHLKESRVSP